ncbi:MAG: aminopeptidase N [Chitinivorax sp.]
MSASTPSTIYLHDYSPAPYLIDRVDLRFEIHNDYTEVHSRLVIKRHEMAQPETPLVLTGQEMELLQVKLDGEPLAPAQYLLDDTSLTLPQLADSCIVEIVTRLQPQLNTSLMGLYASNGNLFTQCEAEGFRKITYFLDRPDVMARYTTTIVADKQKFPVLLSNGNLVGQGSVDKQRHWVKWVDPFRKPSYLFALVAGKLVKLEDQFKTHSGKSVKLEIYVEPGNLDKCAHAMSSLKKAMKWDEDVYGLEYDLDVYMIVAVGDFNMGAMENKGLNVFNTKYVLAKPETATDVDYEGIEAVIAHEYFHNWTGNRVTCRDWFQLSLKEGLTVFRDQEFSADMTSRAVQRIEQVRTLRNLQFPEDAGPMAHPVRPASYIEINNFYTVTVYEKGAEVVRMYQTLFGRVGFRKGMDLYFRRHDGQAVTCDDFRFAMADANEADLSQFALWYSQAGTPVVQASGMYDAARQCYTLNLRQSCPVTPDMAQKQPFLIPLELGLLDADGNDMPLQLAGEEQHQGTSRVLRLTQREQQFEFINLPQAPVPSLLRGFSAPVKLEVDLSDEHLMFLMAHDSDSFNRWEAGQTLALRIMLRLIDDYRQGSALHLPQGFVESMRRTLTDGELDAALIAQALTLPTEVYVAEQMAQIDPDAIHVVREFIRHELASALQADLVAVHQACQKPGAYRYDAASAGLRALKNTCLAYLLLIESPEARQWCVQQANAADNMTDSLAALSALTHYACPERSPTLDAFFERWKNEPLVVDKWLALRASATLPGTLDDVKSLVSHPAFQIRNPNKVRALLGMFAHGNQLRFHAADGEGYRFIAEQVAVLDELNPQLAARMASAFNRWRRFDPARQALMREQLLALMDRPKLSSDVFEIVSKSLQS